MKEVACGHLGSSGTSSSSFRLLTQPGHFSLLSAPCSRFALKLRERGQVPARGEGEMPRHRAEEAGSTGIS